LPLTFSSKYFSINALKKWSGFLLNQISSDTSYFHLLKIRNACFRSSVFVDWKICLPWKVGGKK
jgi:hypothetical protein